MFDIFVITFRICTVISFSFHLCVRESSSPLKIGELLALCSDDTSFFLHALFGVLTVFFLPILAHIAMVYVDASFSFDQFVAAE